eukprot:1161342-Pelagomonas_calceolata.AAC.16
MECEGKGYITALAYKNSLAEVKRCLRPNKTTGWQLGVGVSTSRQIRVTRGLAYSPRIWLIGC